MQDIINKIINNEINNYNAKSAGDIGLSIRIKDNYYIDFPFENLMILISKNGFLDDNNKLISKDKTIIEKKILRKELNSEIDEEIKNIFNDFKSRHFITIGLDDFTRNFISKYKFKITRERIIYGLRELNHLYELDYKKDFVLIRFKNNKKVSNIPKDVLTDALINACKNNHSYETIKTLLDKGRY